MPNSSLSAHTAPVCAVIETHFVGDYATAPVRLPSLTLSQFEAVLDTLLAEYEPITAMDLRRWMAGESTLPARSFYLTFDDGIRDHAVTVLPALERRGIEGAFFVPGSIFDTAGRLPTLERQRFLQYAFSDYRTFLDSFIASAMDMFPALQQDQLVFGSENLRRMGDYLGQYSFYSTEERYYRWLRDRVLAPEQFIAVTNSLFAERFQDERELMDTYYMSADDLRTIARAGMPIGCHGYAHEHLPRLANQSADLRRGIGILESIVGETPWIASYPYGSYDAATLGLMRSLGMAFAFTTNNRIAVLDRSQPYQIERLDIAVLAK